MTPAAVSVEGLCKRFPPRPSRPAVRDLTFAVAPGEIFGLIGPNGSGKSTTLKLLLGLLTPTAGRCRLFGQPCEHPDTRQLVGYLPEAPPLYPTLTGREFVLFSARLSGLAGSRLPQAVARALAAAEVGLWADRRIATYSKGQRQRIGLAQALVHDPPLLVLDEPLAGLDPAGVAALLTLLRRLRDQGRTVLLSAHFLPAIEELCDAVVMLHAGRNVLAGRLAELAGSAGHQSLTVDALSEAQLQALRHWLAAQGRTLHAVAPARAGLEQRFLTLSSRSTEDSAPCS